MDNGKDRWIPLGEIAGESKEGKEKIAMQKIKETLTSLGITDQTDILLFIEKECTRQNQPKATDQDKAKHQTIISGAEGTQTTSENVVKSAASSPETHEGEKKEPTMSGKIKFANEFIVYHESRASAKLGKYEIDDEAKKMIKQLEDWKFKVIFPDLFNVPQGEYDKKELPKNEYHIYHAERLPLGSTVKVLQPRILDPDGRLIHRGKILIKNVP